MVSRAYTVAFEGVDPREVEVQVALSAGMPGFAIVGLPDKAVSEARERIKAALSSMGIALPAKRVTVNLSPADLPKEGLAFRPAHRAWRCWQRFEMHPGPEEVEATIVALGELSLDGSPCSGSMGALPAALAAAEADRSLVVPAANAGAEAAWVRSNPCLRTRRPSPTSIQPFHRPEAISRPRRCPAKSRAADRSAAILP